MDGGQGFVQLVDETTGGQTALPWVLLTMLLDSSCLEHSKATKIRNAQWKAQVHGSTMINEAPSTKFMPLLDLESLHFDFGDVALHTHSFTHSFTVKQSAADAVKTQVTMQSAGSSYERRYKNCCEQTENCSLLWYVLLGTALQLLAHTIYKLLFCYDA